MTATGSYSQDFNTLISTGSGTWTDNSNLLNWYAKRSGTGNTIAADTGTANGGDLYSYGSTSSNDRALGSLGSGGATAGNFAWGTLLQNNSLFTITDIKVSFVGEQWRSSAAVAQTISFYYKISSTSITDLQPNTNSGWTAVSNLNFTSPIIGGTAGALNGNNAANRLVKANISIPSLNLPAGSYILIKWDDPDHTGIDHGLSIDDVAINWTVNSVVKPEPSDFPTNFSCGTTTNSAIPLSWDDATGTTNPDGYLIKWSSTSYAAIPDPVDGTAEANSSTAQNVAQGTQSFTATALSSNTPYYFKIWSYANSGTTIDYKLVGEPQTSCSTLAAPCVFLEDFSNIPTDNQTSYLNRTWSGTAGTWTATNARTDQVLTGKSIATNNTGSVTAPLVNNGLGNLSFNYVRAFTGNSARTIQVWVNGSQVGSDIVVSPSSNTVQNYSRTINLPGNVQFELRTSGSQIIIDDIAWTCFTGTPEPNINIQGNGVTIADGDATPSTTDNTDFGAAIISGTDVEKTFTLQNMGSTNLILDDPAVVLLDGSNGFTVSAQPATNPMAAFTDQTFKVNFNNPVPGTYVETVMIGSNDPDTAVYTFEIKAVVLQPAITTDKTALTGFTYPFAQGPSPTQSFVVNGTNLGGDITATASGNWEISSNLTYDGGNVSPWSTVVFTKSAANAVTNKTLHVRLKDGLAVGTYSGTVTLTSSNAATKTVTLAGEVIAGIRDIKVTGNGTSIANGSLSPSGLNNTLFASQNLGNSQTKVFEIKNLGGEPLTIGAINILGADASSFSVVNAPTVGTVLNQNQIATFEIKFAPTTIGTKNATVNIVNNDPNDDLYFFAIRGGATYCSSAGEIIIARQDFELTPGLPVMNYTATPFGIISPGASTGFSSGDSGNNSAPKNNNLYSEGARGYRIQGGDLISETPSGVSFSFDHVDTSAYTNITLSFKIAGFSLGSTGNGMDDLNAAQENTTIHADKLDYVLVEVSPDDGVNWYLQAKVVSGALNLPWSFASAGTTAGSRNYAADNNLSYFNSISTARYSAISITNLPAVPNLKVRISAQDNALNESWILDDVRITSTGLVPKVWNGSGWLPSAPQPSDKAIINADYNSSTNGGFQVCQCEINGGATLTVAAATEVKVSDFLVNNGKVIVEPNGNFTQVNETDTNSGSGDFKVLQNLPLSTERKQYNYLISPTLNTNLKNIYKDAGGNPVEVPFVLYHSEATNFFYASTGDYIKGRALAVKEAATSFAPVIMTATFVGKPANGAFTYNLVNSNPGNINRGYNLTGNPYPSNIDLVKFYSDNVATGNLSPTFYFWDNKANTQVTQMGDLYLGQAYAQFNAATPPGIGTPTKALGDPGAAGVKLPTRYAKVGQGFMTKVINGASLTITFSNSIRKAETAEGFFGKETRSEPQNPVNRYWLNMITPENKASNIAVVYFEEGDNAFTKEDSRDMGGSDAIYSWVDGEKVSINGKSDFIDTDVVSIGTSHFAPGNYTIALDKVEGIFANGQNIYLKDNQSGILTNLSVGNYSFDAAAGETNSRFEIIYKPETILTTDSTSTEELIVYKDSGDFVVRSQTKKITDLEVYDANGRLLVKLQPNQTKAIIPGEALVNGVYILKITQSGKITTRKIIK